MSRVESVQSHIYTRKQYVVFLIEPLKDDCRDGSP